MNYMLDKEGCATWYIWGFLPTVHHFNLGRRMPGFDYGPDGFGTGLTPLHLSDDGEGGAFHFHDPPPPYTAYKYPDIQHPDDPPPPYEASINPDSILCSPPGMLLALPGLAYCCLFDLFLILHLVHPVPLPFSILLIHQHPPPLLQVSEE